MFALKFLVLDGHASARDGLAALLAERHPDAIVLEAGDLSDALRLAAAHEDLGAVLLALPASGGEGLDAISAFGHVGARPPVIVLSACETAREAREALARGAVGYVPRSANPRSLLSAVRLVLDGDLYVPPLVLDEAADEARAARARLTERQVEVLRRVSDGQSNKAIALALGVSEKTVKAHATAIFRALNVGNRAEAAAAGREAGLV